MLFCRVVVLILFFRDIVCSHCVALCFAGFLNSYNKVPTRHRPRSEPTFLIMKRALYFLRGGRWYMPGPHTQTRKQYFHFHFYKHGRNHFLMSTMLLLLECIVQEAELCICFTSVAHALRGALWNTKCSKKVAPRARGEKNDLIMGKQLE